ncbi:hypothetical protein GQ53DRAFT_23388 [Thozetella sp. PMI_491]|nr:hypothetical protein GQ53DRAFT_23388 [Thozetella sp. PMI_491]
MEDIRISRTGSLICFVVLGGQPLLSLARRREVHRLTSPTRDMKNITSTFYIRPLSCCLLLKHAPSETSSLSLIGDRLLCVRDYKVALLVIHEGCRPSPRPPTSFYVLPFSFISFRFCVPRTPTHHAPWVGFIWEEPDPYRWETNPWS